MTELEKAAPTGDNWDGAEEWMPLAWALCAEECGEEACTELVWEGGPIPEPWGDRWLKYEGEAKRLIALVREHVPALTQAIATTEPVKPLFAAKVAAQKWAELQEQGHRMQTLSFDGGPGGAGTIDPWGKVTWSKTAPATTERKGEPVAWMLWTHGPVLAFLNKDEAKLEFDRLNHAHPEPARKLIPLYTSPQVPEDVIAILDECRTALMECDRDCDYKLIERIDAVDAARK